MPDILFSGENNSRNERARYDHSSSAATAVKDYGQCHDIVVKITLLASPVDLPERFRFRRGRGVRYASSNSSPPISKPQYAAGLSAGCNRVFDVVRGSGCSQPPRHKAHPCRGLDRRAWSNPLGSDREAAPCRHPAFVRLAGDGPNHPDQSRRIRSGSIAQGKARQDPCAFARGSA